MTLCSFCEKFTAIRIKLNQPKKHYIPVTIEGSSAKYRLLPNGELIEPIKVIPFKHLSDKELDNEILRLEMQLSFEDNIDKTQVNQKLKIALDEQKSRGVKNVD